MRGEPGQENLSAAGDEAQIEQLVKELKSEDEVIRARAADQVGMLGEGRFPGFRTGPNVE